jgi:uncharacterized protein (DUF1501 family)
MPIYKLISDASLSSSRRRFIGGSAAWVAGLAAGSFGVGLQSIASAARGDDYKALVCVFLYGGNDSDNTVIP